MNTAIWTLWLSSVVLGQGSTIVTPLATYPTQEACIFAARGADAELHIMYAGAQNGLPISVGLFFCVHGDPVKR